MLEGVLANLLNRVLGMYVKNFDPKDLSVGIWNGDVKLRNLELRKEALDQLHLPLNVVEGHIGELTLSIPWSNLKGKPVKVSIEDVFVLAAPREDADYDPEEDEKRQHAVKMEKLNSAELLKERNTEGMSREEQQRQQSFVASLSTAIIDNIQVTIKNIHIRFEDSISDPGHPFAAGLTLSEFSAVSTDGNWQPAFIKGTAASTHKLAKLGALAVYWDTDAKLLGTGKGSDTMSVTQGLKHDQLMDTFKSMIVHEEDETIGKHQYILKPVSGQLGIEMDQTGKTDKPKIKARLFFDELGFVIDDEQYRDALMLVDLFHYFILHQEYKKFQPKSAPKEDPRAWLRFAGQAILDKIHDRNRKWSWEYFKERRDDRKKYILLFKRTKQEEKLSTTEADELEKLERKLTYEDLRFWRSLARNELRKENAGVKKAAPEKQSWSSWIWHGGKNPQAAEEVKADDDTTITEEERTELYAVIDYDEKKAITEAVDLPKDSVKLQVHMHLQTGSFTLKRDPHRKNNEILKLLFDSFHTSFIQRPDSMLAKMSLQGMHLHDGTTPGTLYPEIITVKDQEDAMITDGAISGGEILTSKDEELEKCFDNAFFSLGFEQNPLDGHADSAVTIKLKAMEILYNPRFVVEAAKFFTPPERQMESIGALMESASATVEGIRQQTRAGLEFALAEHKTIDAQFDLKAPLIIVPDTVTEESKLCLIIDAGHASVSSELIDKATLQGIETKQSQAYTEKDYEKLESLMYDKFSLKLDSTQILIGPSVKETRAQLETSDSTRNYHLIDRINMDFMVENCIVPKDTHLTKFRITGSLPVLHASISDSKYKQLMRILEVAVPKFSEDETSEKPATQVPVEPSRRFSLAADGSAKDPRSKSFQFSAQESELIVEEEHEEFKNADVEDAQTEDTQPETNISQRTFEFNFVVEKLQGSLYRSDPEGKAPDQLLAELVAERFRLQFYQRPFDMVAEVNLKALTLEDHVEKDPMPEFRNIISSEDDLSQSEDLFAVKFQKVDGKSPEFMTVHEGIATNLDVAISTINLVVTRRTLLTLLDFVLITFASSDSPEQPQALPNQHDDSHQAVEVSEPAPSTEKIRIKTELKRIAVILNDDGIRLATLSLSTANVRLTLMGNTMCLGARLGSMSLIDDVNEGVSAKSALRQLVAIDGDELLDFNYTTYDANLEGYPGYDSSIQLRSGSIKISFVTEPFRKIMDFAVKFGKMQAIYNAAREAAANQATNIQERATKMHFDIVVSTPIVVIPRIVIGDKPERDLLTAYLGEIYASNRFVPLDDRKDSETANELSVGIRKVRLTSLLHYPGSQSEELELIDKVDLSSKVTYIEHKPGYKRPDLEVRASLSDINLKITPQQLKFAMELSRSVPAAFSGEPEEVIEQEIENEVPKSTQLQAEEAADRRTEAVVASPNPAPSPELEEEKWTKVDLIFKAGSVGLELILGKDEEPIGDLEAASLSRFSINDTNVKLRMVSDGSMESELLIQSFTITDTRKHETNKFRKIMSLSNTEVTQQFMANVSISGGKDQNLLAVLSIDSPQIILALEYIFAIQAFVNAGLAVAEPLQIVEEEEEEEEEDTESDLSSESRSMTKRNGTVTVQPEEEAGSMSMAFRVNMVDAQIILLANAAISTSEAVVLGLKQAVVAKQHATTVQAEKIGMFLCRMDRFDSSRLRILDDFSIATSLDVRTQGESSSLTNIHVDIEPLVLRLSLRDILLAMQIVSKASAMTTTAESGGQEGSGSETISSSKGVPTRPGTVRKTSTHINMAKSIQTRRSAVQAAAQEKEVASAILKREELDMHIGGIRVVLIGDKHEIPFLDWNVNEFDVGVRDWSGAMVADVSIDTYLNVYNFSKSAWEPLIEPWALSFHMSKEQNPDKMSIDLISRKSLELTITTATIALASKSFDFLSTDEDVLAKPRGSDAPFRIRNYTGFPLRIWARNENGQEGSAAKMEDGEEIPWRFEDPTKMRETLSPEGANGVVGIKLEDSGFDSIDRIPVNREGEVLYNLMPRKDKVLHRILVEVKLGIDYVKYVTIRSPLVVENNTQIPIELGVYSPDEGHLLKIEKIAPGQARPSPVGACFMHSLVVRPDQGFGYNWSRERLFWKDLLKKQTQVISCKGEEDENATPPFYFQMFAEYDKTNPLTTTYPYMRVHLSAPVEIHNLLPYDFKYLIYDKNTKKDWTNFLRKGGVSPVHVVNLAQLLLVSVDLQDTPFKQSEHAIINSPDREFSREKTLVTKDNRDLTLRLKLHYFTEPNRGGAFKLSIYSPYVILNRTGLPLDIRSKTFFSNAKAAAGQGVLTGDTSKASPLMFSFPSDDQKNRAMLRIGDSGWSKPQSFNALGSTYEVTIPSQSGRGEMHLGVSVSQGEGEYKLTNVVTVAPRYIIKNKVGEDINIREPGSADITTIKADGIHALRAMRQTSGQQLSLCFPGVNNQWSWPFNISNLGRIWVKIAKEKQRQRLVEAQIFMEAATIFIHLKISEHWPYSIKNESDVEFLFWQANPNVEEDEEDRGSGWRPIKYRVPPRSVMPYAWDYPASKNKDLIITTAGKERTVKLAEIGPQIPLKLPPTQGQTRQKIIDIEVLADGPRQSLVLSNWKASQSMYKQKSGKITQSTVGFEVKELDRGVTLSAQIRFAGVGISLINKSLRELLYITFRDIDVKYIESDLYQTLDWTTKWIQLDNQLYGGIFPILLYPSVVPKTGKEMEAHPIFHTAVTRVKDDSYGVLYIKYFTVLLQQMTIELDEDFIYALLDFVKIPGASWAEEKQGKLCDEELNIPEPIAEEQGQDVYFELLHLQPMQVDLSFVRTEHVNAEDTMTTNNPLTFAVNVLTMSIGNVNDAPLRYNAMLVENARITFGVLVGNIQNHYVQESLRQVHIVLGSADFLGNPVGLFNNVSSGFADIFYEPYQGLVNTDRPQDLGIGIAKGASSFVKKSVFGFSDSVAKWTGSVSKGLAAASLDKEFQDQRRMSRARNRPKHALYGITAGGNAFANSLASGIGGLARHPLEGAEKEGALGFMKGVGKGVLGIATKPAIGAFDLASNLAEGVRNTTTVFDQEGLDRVRLTRFVGQDGIVRPYSQREALGQFWLKTVDNGRYFNDSYIAHLELSGKEMLVMLTYNDIMLVRSKKLTTEWDVPLKDVQRISKERTGFAITLKEGRNGPFVPIADETQRAWFYKQVAVAVSAYNERWQGRGG